MSLLTESVSAATIDVAGELVLVVVYQTLYAYDVSGGTVDLVQTVTITDGTGTFDYSSFVEITVDSTSVYLEATGSGGLVIVDATINDVSGDLKLGTVANLAASYKTDFVAAHPDGTYLYAGRTDHGKVGEYVRTPADGSLSAPCNDADGTNSVFNRALVSPNGMYLYVIGQNELKAYRTHTVDPITPSPVSPATPSPGVPGMPTASPVPAPAVTVLPDAPKLDSAVLSDTQSAFSLTFSSTCYCVEETGSVGDVAVCGFDIQSGNFDRRCDISRMLGESILNTFGNQSTCEWSEDSLTAVVTYDETYEGSWLAGMNITLADGYILGGVPSEAGVLEYATGTEALQGRTPAPELLEAKFSNDGGSVVVTFAPEGSATSGLLDSNDAASGSGPGSCGALLNASSIPPLGEGPACEWTGERELSIVLGYDAYVVPAAGAGGSCVSPLSCITLKEGGITTEAFAILSSAGSTPVLAPENPPAVSAVLVAPQTVGLCGTLKLDGRASSGALSRSLSSSWNVSASSTMSASLNALLVFFQGSLVAEVNATSLVAGIEHTFTLMVENFLGDYDEATVEITRIAEDAPSVVVLGAASRTVTRSRSTSLRMAATPPACGEHQLLTYSWSEAGGNGYDEIGTDVFQDLEQVDVTTITLPAYTLGYPGSSYLFAATATSQTSGATSSATVEVTVTQGAVRANIEGGHFRQHTAGGDLVLDGSGSIDEDDIAELSLRYDWSCLRNCSTLQSDWTTNDEGSVVVIPSQGLESGTASLEFTHAQIFEFSLTVSIGSADASEVFGLFRWDNASVKVQVISFEAPQVVVLAKDTASKHDPTQKLVIYGSAEEQASSYDLLWTQTAGDLDLDEQAWDTLFATAQRGLNLVVRPKILTGGSTYTFRLSATDVNSGAAGLAEVSVLMNAAPTGGHVEVTPRAGRAAIDTFVLESLDWTDEVDDLPLMFSFAYINGQDESDQQRGLSTFASESPEWQGSLPLGPSTSNYSMLIVGHVSDTYGATSTSTRDATGISMTVRVTGWNVSPGDATLLDIYAATLEETRDTPGRATTTVRAYASLLVEQHNETSLHSSEETDLHRVSQLGSVSTLSLTLIMVNDVTDDFESLECSTTTVGAVLDTLALVSSIDISQGAHPKVAVLSSSAGVLDRALGEGTWDSQTFSPVLELLDNVLGGFNASGGVIGREDLGDTAAEVLPGVIDSMKSLMESDLEDGEDAMEIANNHVHVLCLVTSTTSAITLDSGSSLVSVPAGVLDSSRQRRERRRLSSAFSTHPSRVPEDTYIRRRLESIATATPSTVAVATVQFNAKGRPSNEVDAGVTSITISTPSDDQVVSLSAPVRMTLRGSMGTTLSKPPACVYFNENKGGWDNAGLATGASMVSVNDVGGDTTQPAVNNATVTCVTFHLSDFTMAIDDVGTSFRPIDVTAGVAVILKIRDISRIGVILLLMVVLLLVIARVASRMADGRSKLKAQLAGRTDANFLSTGKPLRHPTFSSVLVEEAPADALRHHKRRRNVMRRSRKRGLPAIRRYFTKRVRGLGRRAKVCLSLILKWHPWFGIVSPSSSSLVLTREQLSLLIFAQIMVHMMVEALVIGNSPDYKIRVAHIIVSLVISMPASIIIPKLYAAASAPPPSITTSSERKYVRTRTPVYRTVRRDSTSPRCRWMQDSNTVVALLHLVSSTVAAGSRASRGGHASQPFSAGMIIDRGTHLVLSGLCQMMLDLVCIGLASAIRVDEEVDKAMVFTTVGGLVAALLFLADAILSTRDTSFSIINFKVVFTLVFLRMVFTALQMVFAFHGVRNKASSAALYMSIFILSLAKIVGSHKSELTPCMDGMNQSYMDQVCGRLTFLLSSSQQVSGGVSSSSSTNAAPMPTLREPLPLLTFLIPNHFFSRSRTIRREEVLVWHCPQVEKIKRSIRFRANACLFVYTLTVVWINLCYVATYDSAAVRSWLTASGLSVLADILLRKPLSVLAIATFFTIRDTVCVPQEVYVGTGRSQRSIVNF
ncbi:unnamed protein product [Scytosiphon promiscuus]